MPISHKESALLDKVITGEEILTSQGYVVEIDLLESTFTLRKEERTLHTAWFSTLNVLVTTLSRYITKLVKENSLCS